MGPFPTSQQHPAQPNYSTQLRASCISQPATEHPVHQRGGQGIQVQLTKEDELLLTCALMKRTQTEQK